MLLLRYISHIFSRHSPSKTFMKLNGDYASYFLEALPKTDPHFSSGGIFDVQIRKECSR